MKNGQGLKFVQRLDERGYGVSMTWPLFDEKKWMERIFFSGKKRWWLAAIIFQDKYTLKRI